tara:strand:+ start:5806 stop:6513 length:708 start_codon:yes stop_codon:yes gene_type:complete
LNLSVLTSDTPHHRYFLNKINEKHKIDSVFYETKSLKPKFDNSSPFEAEEIKFERKEFFKNCPDTLIDVDSFFFESLNSKEAVFKLNSRQPNIGVVFGTGKLSTNVIGQFSDHLMNIHRGIPQKYRGLDSDLWAILNDDFANLGTTLHLVEPDLDTGNIIGQRILEINKTMRTYMIRYYTTLIATDLVIKALDDYKFGTLKHFPQETLGDYYSFMDKDKKIKANQKFISYCKNIK